MALQTLKKLPPQTIVEFRELDDDQDVFIPEHPQNRRATDTPALVLFALFILALSILVMIAILTNTNYTRFLNGYDKCGDACGMANYPIIDISCSGKNLTNNSIMQYTYVKGKKDVPILVPDTCIAKCIKPNRLFFRRCLPPNGTSDKRSYNIISLAEFFDDIEKSGKIVIIPMMVIGTVLSMTFYCSMRYFPNVTMITVLVTSLFGGISFIAYSWYQFPSNKNLIYINIVFTIIILLLCILSIYYYDKYQFIARIFKESSAVTFKMRIFFVLPFGSIICFIIVTVLSICVAPTISTNEALKRHPDYPDVHYYKKTALSKNALIFLIAGDIWILMVANGFQCMTVALAVSAYYFQGQNRVIPYSITRYILIVLKYHLGSIAFGSLCISVLCVVRIILTFFEDRMTCKCPKICVRYCFIFFDELIHYITKKAYIETAMHGKSLYKSGARAAKLLWLNLMDTIALDVAAEFIMICSILLIVLICALIGIIIGLLIAQLELTAFWLMIFIGNACVGIIAYFFSEVFNVSTETILLCFCEDKLLNNGASRPYYMSDELKSILTEAKQSSRRHENLR